MSKQDTLISGLIVLNTSFDNDILSKTTYRLGNSLISAIFSPGKSGPRAVGGITDGGVIPGETKESWMERSITSCESDVG